MITIINLFYILTHLGGECFRIRLFVQEHLILEVYHRDNLLAHQRQTIHLDRSNRDSLPTPETYIALAHIELCNPLLGEKALLLRSLGERSAPIIYRKTCHRGGSLAGQRYKN